MSVQANHPSTNQTNFPLNTSISFEKWQGTGNDFILSLSSDLPANWQASGYENGFNPEFRSFAVKSCDRNFGIGADGWLLVEKKTSGDYKMHVINADGSIARMCGNGLRCVARYLYKKNLIPEKSVIDTASGEKAITIEENEQVTISMGHSIVLGNKSLPASVQSRFERLKNIEGILVDTGNLHFVIFNQKFDHHLIESISPFIEQSPDFPKALNIHFVEILDEMHIVQQTWENGVGITLACGTGACASVTAGVSAGFIQRNCLVDVEGGSLQIHLSETNELTMTGSASLVFTGACPTT